jgi:hypothetical protein
MDWLNKKEKQFLNAFVEFHRAIGESLAHFICQHLRMGHEVLVHRDPFRECMVIRCATCDPEFNNLDDLVNHVRAGCPGSILCGCDVALEGEDCGGKIMGCKVCKTMKAE